MNYKFKDEVILTERYFIKNIANIFYKNAIEYKYEYYQRISEDKFIIRQTDLLSGIISYLHLSSDEFTQLNNKNTSAGVK